MNFLMAVAVLLAAETAPVTDGEVWNEGVGFYASGDVTNVLGSGATAQYAENLKRCLNILTAALAD